MGTAVVPALRGVGAAGRHAGSLDQQLVLHAADDSGRGRPPVLPMPEPIPDTPENIARAIMQGPPKAEWDFEREAERRRNAVRAD